MWYPFKRQRERRRIERRDIFRYWDGTRWRYADPLTAWAQLWSDPACNLKDTLPGAMRGDLEDAAEIAALSRRVFKLDTFDGTSGATQLEALDVLYELLAFMGNLKKKREPSATTSAPTDSISSPETSTTPRAADSSSNQTESTGGEARSS